MSESEPEPEPESESECAFFFFFTFLTTSVSAAAASAFAAASALAFAASALAFAASSAFFASSAASSAFFASSAASSAFFAAAFFFPFGFPWVDGESEPESEPDPAESLELESGKYGSLLDQPELPLSGLASYIFRSVGFVCEAVTSPPRAYIYVGLSVALIQLNPGIAYFFIPTNSVSIFPPSDFRYLFFFQVRNSFFCKTSSIF